MEFKVHKEIDLQTISRQIIKEISKSRKPVFLYGHLGSGKTTLVREMCNQLGFHGGVTSPSFPIIQEYSFGNDLIYHIDLYRLESLYEALDIGIEEYLFSANYCFVEWPEIIENIVSQHWIIKILVNDDHSRTITTKLFM